MDGFLANGVEGAASCWSWPTAESALHLAPLGSQPRTIESVRLRYYVDREPASRTFYNHDVSETEVEDVLTRPIEDRVGDAGSRVVIGQTEAGRYLRVVYVPDPLPDSAFIIIGYELGPRALKALRRRRRRKQ